MVLKAGELPEKLSLRIAENFNQPSLLIAQKERVERLPSPFNMAFS